MDARNCQTSTRVIVETSQQVKRRARRLTRRMETRLMASLAQTSFQPLRADSIGNLLLLPVLRLVGLQLIERRY